MHLLLLRFSVPKTKLYEFDLALERLVKWPVFRLQAPRVDTDQETFEFIRSWESSEDMQADLSSHTFNNLIGVIKVLGKVKQSNIYKVDEQTDFSLEYY